MGGGSLTGAADGGDGISVGGDMTVTGGEVTGTTDGEDSDGISLNGNLRADGGNVSGSATDGSGIRAFGGLTVDDGEVSGSGGGAGKDGVYVFNGPDNKRRHGQRQRPCARNGIRLAFN